MYKCTLLFTWPYSPLHTTFCWRGTLLYDTIYYCNNSLHTWPYAPLPRSFCWRGTYFGGNTNSWFSIVNPIALHTHTQTHTHTHTHSLTHENTLFEGEGAALPISSSFPSLPPSLPSLRLRLLAALTGFSSSPYIKLNDKTNPKLN